jgi:hypothetical protein
MSRLDDVSKLPVEYPDWMIAAQAASRVPPSFKRKG